MANRRNFIRTLLGALAAVFAGRHVKTAVPPAAPGVQAGSAQHVWPQYGEPWVAPLPMWPVDAEIVDGKLLQYYANGYVAHTTEDGVHHVDWAVPALCKLQPYCKLFTEHAGDCGYWIQYDKPWPLHGTKRTIATPAKVAEWQSLLDNMGSHTAGGYFVPLWPGEYMQVRARLRAVAARQLTVLSRESVRSVQAIAELRNRFEELGIEPDVQFKQHKADTTKL